MDERPVPHSYRDEVRRLRQRVAHLERQLRLRDRPASPATAGECLECGAKDGEPCVTARGTPFVAGNRQKRRHHLRGRTGPCGSPWCQTCVTYFGSGAAE